MDANRIVELDAGRRVGVACYGVPDGVPILGLHGAPASRLMFDVSHQIAVQLGATIYAADRPNYGLTQGDWAVDLEARADFYRQVADKLGLSRFHVIGISGGAPYAVALAAMLGDRVRGLALVSPMGPVADCVAENAAKVHPLQRRFFLDIPKHEWFLRAYARTAAAAFRAAPRTFTEAFARSLSPSDRAALEPASVRNSLIRMTEEAVRQGSAGGVEDLIIFSRAWNVDFDKVSARSVLWQGSDDRIVPAAVSLELGRRLPGCDIRSLPGQGHFWVYGEVRHVLETLTAL